MFAPFVNEPLTSFSDPAAKAQMEDALRRVRGALGRRYDLIIGGANKKGTGEITSIDPGDGKTIVGRVAKASAADVEAAIEAGWKAFAGWRKTPPETRARILVKAAAEMRRRKFELAAWEVYEAGKAWAEADGDVAEAIDFLEYYARQMVRLARPIDVTQLPGEEDEAFYQPLGVGAIIPPWNFPLAILAGMTTAAVVAGNAVILKPASPTPVMGAKFMEIMAEAGLPAGVINFIPGDGSEIGDLMVGHPRIRFISFTGSREVGLHINALAARHQPGQRWIKRVVAEMGGKDAILVDETADVGAAIEAITASAFGFQGQKCSACSRAIIVDSLYDEVLAGVVERSAQLKMGHPQDETVRVGPVIDHRAMMKIEKYVEDGRTESKLLLGGERPTEEGYYVAPTIFGDVDPHSALGQEEIFGPVLALIRAKDFEEGLKIVNGTEYGLTGSLYSRDRQRIERARSDFEAGNLYINRKCTGAMVGAHPFGGFNMSGTDSKTGSPDYLLLFMQMKSVAEKF